VKRTIRKINAITQAHLMRLLVEGNYNCKELAEETGLHYVTVLQYTRELHRFGACHISGWDKDGLGRDIIKIYKLGPGKDAKRERLTDKEKQARHRSKAHHLGLISATAGTLKDRSLEQAFGVGRAA